MVVNERQITIPNSAGNVILWGELVSDGTTVPYYAVSLDGADVDEVRPALYDLMLAYARFDPALEQPLVDEALVGPEGSELFVVQFVTQSLEEFRAEVRRQGATVYGALSNYAHRVRIPAQARGAVEALPFVRAVVPDHPAYRLEPSLRGELTGGKKSLSTQRYNLLVFLPEQRPVVAERVVHIGGSVDSANAGKRLLEATLAPEQVLQVASWDELAFVDRWSAFELDMANVREVCGANDLEDTAGYSGAGGPGGAYVSDIARVRGEVLDVGFNLGHDDFASRPLIVHGHEVTFGLSNHGAHTSGMIFGDGASEPLAVGLLPAGQGIVTDVTFLGGTGSEASRYTHTGQLVDASHCPTSPPDSNCPYQAVFQSLSGGSEYTTAYTPTSHDLDEMLFDLDLVRCQAQGNNGDNKSRAQAWAKNAISVGGVKHYDDGIWSNDRWKYGGDSHYETLCTATAPGAAASIGPASDGRSKPDLAGFFDCIYTTNCCLHDSYNTGFNGTSAATPMVCGNVALLMEMWGDDADGDGKNMFGMPVVACNPATENCVFKRRPHAATAKAMLINTARQYDWLAAPFIPNGDIARERQGWGVPRIINVYNLREKMVIVDESFVLSNLLFKDYLVKVPSGEPEFKATLVYRDPPGDPGNQARHAVNDLTLKVTAPDGTRYWGNCGLREDIWSSSYCTERNHPILSEPAVEIIDTVENVFVENPPPGIWTVRVRADEINQDAHCLSVGCYEPDDPNDPDDAAFALVMGGVLAAGKCLLPGGGCVVTDRADCIAQSGTYVGDNLNCAPQ